MNIKKIEIKLKFLICIKILKYLSKVHIFTEIIDD